MSTLKTIAEQAGKHLSHANEYVEKLSNLISVDNLVLIKEDDLLQLGKFIAGTSKKERNEICSYQGYDDSVMDKLYDRAKLTFKEFAKRQ